MTQHRDPLDAHAGGEAGVALGVVAGGGEHLGVHHPRAEDLEPAAAAADGAARLGAGAGEAVDGDLDAGLDEREIGVPQQHAALDAEELAGELQQRALEIGERDALVDGEQLDLRHHPLVRRVGRLVAVAAARHGDAHRRIVGVEVADLHRRGMGAQQQRLFAVHVLVEPEGVPHIARGVVLGDAQAGEVVVVELHLGALDGGEAHAREGVEDLLQRLGHGVQSAAAAAAAGQRYIDGALGKLRGERGGAQLLLPRLEVPLEVALERVGGLPGGAPLIGGQRGEPAQHAGERP